VTIAGIAAPVVFGNDLGYVTRARICRRQLLLFSCGTTPHPIPDRKEQANMKKALWVTIVTVVAAAMISCGGKYDDVESTLNDYADAMDDYVAQMDRAENADDVVKAMNHYTENMKSLAPRLQEMNQKFPELASGEAYPQELEKISQRMVDLSQKVQTTMMKSMKYMMDPEVQQALSEQAQAMAQVSQ
jgi:methyl-accepting chemotaxis protein